MIQNSNINDNISKSNYKTKFGGYISSDISTMNKDGKHKKSYTCWYNMMKRCYSDEQPTYKDCFVCDEWLHFSNFEKWYDENYYELDNEKVELDKDILIKGNKEYSPSTAIFVPRRINRMLPQKTKENDCPPGVHIDKCNDNRYKAECTIYKNGKSKKHHLGYFDTPEEAFNVYKTFKENNIKESILQYKDKTPQKQYGLLYNALTNYKVEWDD